MSATHPWLFFWHFAAVLFFAFCCLFFAFLPHFLLLNFPFLFLNFIFVFDFECHIFVWLAFFFVLPARASLVFFSPAGFFHSRTPCLYGADWAQWAP